LVRVWCDPICLDEAGPIELGPALELAGGAVRLGRTGNAREAGGRISAGYQTALAVPGFKFHPGAWANGEILYFSHQTAVVTG